MTYALSFREIITSSPSKAKKVSEHQGDMLPADSRWVLWPAQKFGRFAFIKKVVLI